MIIVYAINRLYICTCIKNPSSAGENKFKNPSHLVRSTTRLFEGDSSFRKRMRILVGCEESQAVTIELRKLGHEAFSCDIQECSGGHPEWHYQQDIFEVINIGWDMLIAFPPCTHLAVSGAAHFAKKIADGRQQEGIDFFIALATCNIPKIAIENPIGIMSSKFRKPDQIIEPYHFGHEAKKPTCLWLKGLPKLKPTNIVSPGEFVELTYRTGKTKKTSKWEYECAKMPLSIRGKMRSKTFPGIAEAMAKQWTSNEKFQQNIQYELDLTI